MTPWSGSYNRRGQITSLLWLIRDVSVDRGPQWEAYMWTSRREDKFASFLGRLPISNILPNSPDFYMFTSQMCSLHHVHLGQQSKMQLERHTCGLLNPLHNAEVVHSHFKVCFNNFIYPPRVDYFTLGWSLFEYLLSFNSKFQNIYF